MTACRRNKDSVQLPPRLPGANVLGLKKPESENAHHAVCNDEVMCVRSYTSTLQYAFVT